jgi:hypothetical protein
VQSHHCSLARDFVPINEQYIVFNFIHLVYIKFTKMRTINNSEIYMQLLITIVKISHNITYKCTLHAYWTFIKKNLSLPCRCILVYTYIGVAWPDCLGDKHDEVLELERFESTLGSKWVISSALKVNELDLGGGGLHIYEKFICICRLVLLALENI